MSVWADKDQAINNLAQSTFHYTNYFKDEIVQSGLTEDFSKLKDIAEKVSYKQNGSVEKFQQKLEEINSKLK
ncbi:hypothetical protein ACNQFZ_02240 [Schinkia sp. CFF1]